MKFQALLFTTLVAMTMAYPHQRPDREEFRLQRLDHFLGMLPEDLRQEIEETIRTAVANGERPQIPDEVRDQIREHMSGLKQQHQEKLNRFMSLLPEKLQREVEELLSQSAANKEFPKASEELRNKIREHFAGLKAERKQRLDKFLSLLPEELRLEVEELLKRPLVNGERPHASEELREKIREHMRGLKSAHIDRLDRFLSMLPEELRQQVSVVLQQGGIGDKIREYFLQMMDQVELLLNFLPRELREQVMKELRQIGAGHGFSEDLRNKLREYFERLLPAELKEQILAEVHQAHEAGVFPVFSEGVRNQLRQLLHMMMTPQLH